MFRRAAQPAAAADRWKARRLSAKVVGPTFRCVRVGRKRELYPQCDNQFGMNDADGA
jgi:hypothetical protein